MFTNDNNEDFTQYKPIANNKANDTILFFTSYSSARLSSSTNFISFSKGTYDIAITITNTIGIDDIQVISAMTITTI
jgi:hypothetical protein